MRVSPVIALAIASLAVGCGEPPQDERFRPPGVQGRATSSPFAPRPPEQGYGLLGDWRACADETCRLGSQQVLRFEAEGRVESSFIVNENLPQRYTDPVTCVQDTFRWRLLPDGPHYRLVFDRGEGLAPVTVQLAWIRPHEEFELEGIGDGKTRFFRLDDVQRLARCPVPSGRRFLRED